MTTQLSTYINNWIEFMVWVKEKRMYHPPKDQSS